MISYYEPAELGRALAIVYCTRGMRWVDVAVRVLVSGSPQGSGFNNLAPVRAAAAARVGQGGDPAVDAPLHDCVDPKRGQKTCNYLMMKVAQYLKHPLCRCC